MYKIGIGITTKGRVDMALKNINALKENIPFMDCKVVVVDDGTEGIMKVESDFRFHYSQGVAIAKNKCLSMLDGCDYLFLLDDDVIIKSHKWYLPYIESGLEHACYTFNRGGFISMGTNYVEYGSPNGCMLFFTRKCIDTVGGFDTDFKGFGFEHVNLSDRIFNAGLTPARYIDVHNSSMYFKLADVPSTFTVEERIKTIPINEKLYKERYYSKEFKPYK